MTLDHYQDAMVAGEPYLYHSLISSYLNAGLLLPLEICKAAEAAYRAGKAPLNSVEGFIRQILGWREYVRGIYWMHMPEYGEKERSCSNKLRFQIFTGGQKQICSVLLKPYATRVTMHTHTIFKGS
jgi:deoxyribodipyrimidine photolyase-related protein